MKVRQSICLFVCLMSFVALNPGGAAAQSFGEKILGLLTKDYDPPAPLLPKGVVKADKYEFGRGAPIGQVDFVENDVYIIHSHAPKTAYRAKKSQPVFEMDTLVCLGDSRLVVLLKDQSHITLNSLSKLKLTKSLYEKEKSFRDTFLEMLAGKARFIVNKISGLREQNYEIQSPVATCGLRGSDFVIMLAPENEITPPSSLLEKLGIVRPAYAQSGLPAMVVVAGENTNLEIQGAMGPPVRLTSFTSTAAFSSRPPIPATPVPASSTPQIFNQIAPEASIMKMPEIFE